MSGGFNLPGNMPVPPISKPSGNYNSLQADTLKTNNIIGNVSLWKISVKITTIINILLTGEQTIDGVAVVAGDRVLVKNQTDGIENGLYIVSTGTWYRTIDLPTGADAVGVAVFVTEGDTYADNIFVCTDDTGSDIVGTDSLTFATLTANASAGGSDTQIQFNNSGVFAGSANFVFDGSNSVSLNNTLQNVLGKSSEY